MSDHADVQHRTGSGEAQKSTSSTSSSSDAPTSDALQDPAVAPSAAIGPSQAVLGPFTARELVFGGGVLLVFLGTLLPFVDGRVLYSTFWSSASLFFIGIGILLPVIAVALLAGRRLGSSTLRVGSLSVDQFASVAAVLAATYFFLQTVTAFHIGPLLALLGALGMLSATVLGPFLPVLKTDFVDRPEVPAHPLARPMTAATPRPRRETSEEQTDGQPERSDAEGQSIPPEEHSQVPEVPDTSGNTGRGSAMARVSAGLRSFGRSKGVDPQDASRIGGATAVTGPSAPTDSWNSRGDEIESPGPDAGWARADSDGLSEDHAGSSKDDQHVPDESTKTRGHSVEDRTRGEDDERRTAGKASNESEEDAGNGRAPAADLSGGAQGSGGSSEQGSVAETRVHEPVREQTPTGGAAHERARQEPITATRAAEEEIVVEAFWFAVGSPRPVFDERTGREIFTLQPGDWEVGIEDRGGEFLVQDKRSGAVGILRDLRNIERAPRD